MRSKLSFGEQESNIFNQCVNVCRINVHILIKIKQASAKLSKNP
jgi:hypothetical protein